MTTPRQDPQNDFTINVIQANGGTITATSGRDTIVIDGTVYDQTTHVTGFDPVYDRVVIEHAPWIVYAGYDPETFHRYSLIGPYFGAIRAVTVDLVDKNADGVAKDINIDSMIAFNETQYGEDFFGMARGQLLVLDGINYSGTDADFSDGNIELTVATYGGPYPGTSGDDVFVLSPDAGYPGLLDGGSGVDTVRLRWFSNSNSTFVFDFSNPANPIELHAPFSVSTLKNFEKLDFEAVQPVDATLRLSCQTTYSIVGGPGDDTLRGGNANDTLIGGPGNDVIQGDQMNNSVNGGHNRLTGGSGSDRFVIGAHNAAYDDTITDFQTGAGGDVLVLDSSWRDAYYRGDLRFVQSGDNVEMQFLQNF